MKGWQRVRVGDLGSIITGTTPSKDSPQDWGEEYLFLTPTDYKNCHKYAKNTIRKLSNLGKDNHKVRLLPKDSIMVTCIGSDMGKVLISSNYVFTNQQINSIIINKSLYDIDFIYYIFLNMEEELKLLGGDGSAVPILNKSDFSDIIIDMPPLPEQRAIASVLSSLDDKIDLLHRQNATLEGMAEALFKKWLVVDAKEEWEVCQLGDILETVESGSRPKGGIDPDLQTGIASIGAESIDGIGKYDFSKTKFITQDFYDQMKRGKIKDYDVLVYKDGAYIGKKGMFALGYPFSECAINEHVFILRANEKASQSFLYFLLQKDEIEALNSNAAQPGINQEALKSLEIILPAKKEIDKFDTIIFQWINKIFINALQIRTLEKLRDTLLPKLMSGEVRVKFK